MLYLQYQKAINLKALIDQLRPILTINEESFYNDFFNILTCKTDGLDNWGIILGQSRGIPIANNENNFGFYKNSSSWVPKPKNFGKGIFFKKRLNPIQNLTDDAYRQLLLLIYGTQSINYSIGACARLLNYYYNTQDITHKVKVDENIIEPMSIRYLFNFDLKPYEFSIYDILVGALPRPIGVSITFLDHQSF